MMNFRALLGFLGILVLSVTANAESVYQLLPTVSGVEVESIYTYTVQGQIEIVDGDDNLYLDDAWYEYTVSINNTQLPFVEEYGISRYGQPVVSQVVISNRRDGKSDIVAVPLYRDHIETGHQMILQTDGHPHPWFPDSPDRFQFFDFKLPDIDLEVGFLDFYMPDGMWDNGAFLPIGSELDDAVFQHPLRLVAEAEAVVVVPVPAAGWLFMSALVGLVSKKRLSRR